MNKNLKVKFRKVYFKLGFLAGAVLTFFLITGWFFGKDLAIEKNEKVISENQITSETNK